jgi:hypothetical protein
MVIDLEKKEQLTSASAKPSGTITAPSRYAAQFKLDLRLTACRLCLLTTGVALDQSLVNYYRQRRIRSLLCVSVPYQRDSYAVIVLQLRHGSTGRVADDWHLDDIILLQEVITQGTPARPPPAHMCRTVVARLCEG